MRAMEMKMRIIFSFSVNNVLISKTLQTKIRPAAHMGGDSVSSRHAATCWLPGVVAAVPERKRYVFIGYLNDGS